MPVFEQITLNNVAFKVRCPESLDECQQRIATLKTSYASLQEDRRNQPNANGQYRRWSGRKLQQIAVELNYLKSWCKRENVRIERKLADSGIVSSQELRNGEAILKKLYWLLKRRLKQGTITLTRDEQIMLDAAEHWLRQQAMVESMQHEIEIPVPRGRETDRALQLLSGLGRGK